MKTIIVVFFFFKLKSYLVAVTSGPVATNTPSSTMLPTTSTLTMAISPLLNWQWGWALFVRVPKPPAFEATFCKEKKKETDKLKCKLMHG